MQGFGSAYGLRCRNKRCGVECFQEDSRCAGVAYLVLEREWVTRDRITVRRYLRK